MLQNPRHHNQPSENGRLKECTKKWKRWWLQVGLARGVMPGRVGNNACSQRMLLRRFAKQASMARVCLVAQEAGRLFAWENRCL